MMEGIDVVVFDIQDVGVRFYTYISSMHYLIGGMPRKQLRNDGIGPPRTPMVITLMAQCWTLNTNHLLVCTLFPLVHGMTVGEFATMINGERWLTGGDTCKLTVIKCRNYTHDSMYQLPVRPSPNLPTMESIYLYPSLGLFEGTNVSIGRGTENPFELVGRPLDDSKPSQGIIPPKGWYKFTPKSIPGVSDHPKYEGVTCLRT